MGVYNLTYKRYQFFNMNMFIYIGIKNSMNGIKDTTHKAWNRKENKRIVSVKKFDCTI